jgi:hypothetical protein
MNESLQNGLFIHGSYAAVTDMAKQYRKLKAGRISIYSDERLEWRQRMLKRPASRSLCCRRTAVEWRCYEGTSEIIP